MIRLNIFLAVIIVCAQVSSAQISVPVEDNIEYNDVIIVTTGGRIVGEIVEFEEGKKVVILREDGERFEIKWKDIARLTKLGAEDQTQQLILDSLAQREFAPRVRPHGTGRLIFSFGDSSSWSGVQALGGTTVLDVFFVSVGSGWEIGSGGDANLLPLFVEATWYPLDGPAVPFFTLEAGHMLGWIDGHRSTDYDGNWIGFSYGVLGSFWDKTGLMFRIGVRQFRVHNHPLIVDKKNRVNFSIGVVF